VCVCVCVCVLNVRVCLTRYMYDYCITGLHSIVPTYSSLQMSSY